MRGEHVHVPGPVMSSGGRTPAWFGAEPRFVDRDEPAAPVEAEWTCASRIVTGRRVDGSPITRRCDVGLYLDDHDVVCHLPAEQADKCPGATA